MAYKHSSVTHRHGEMRTNSKWDRGSDDFCSVDIKARVCRSGVEITFDQFEKRLRHKRGRSQYVNTVLNMEQAAALRAILDEYIGQCLEESD